MPTSSLESLTTAQLEVLRESGVMPPEELEVREGLRIHVEGRAYTDGLFLIFIDDETQPWKQPGFIRAMGAEHQAKLVARFRGVSVYSSIASRLLEPESV